MDRRRDDRRRQRPPSSTLTSIVATAAVAYGTYRLVNWAWNQYSSGREEEETEDIPERHDAAQPPNTSRAPRGVESTSTSPQWWRTRRQRMSRCREEVFMAVEGFLPTLQRIIEERTSTRSETQAMKALRTGRPSSEPSTLDKLSPAKDNQDDEGHQRREQEQDLWNKIQLKLITRMLSTAYAHTILFLVLTVQVNILGGRLLEEQLANSASGQQQQQSSSLASVGPESVASDRMCSYQASHRFVLLHTYDYFFEHGLISLINTVERAVSDILSSNNNEWNVFDRSNLNLSRERMEELINRIRTSVEAGHAYSSSRQRAMPHHHRRSLFRFLMPPSAHVETPMEDELAAAILDETWDIVESPVMMDAQRDCLNTTFGLMRDEHWGKLFVTATGEITTKPLARLIPLLKNTANSFYKQQEFGASMGTSGMGQASVKWYCAMMQALPAVVELADVCF